MAGEGELSAREEARVQSHIAACGTCRARKQEIEAALGEFIRAHQSNFDTQIPPADGPRALLKARMAQRVESQQPSWTHWARGFSWKLSWAILSAACVLGAIAYFVSPRAAEKSREPALAVTVPDPALTPGAIVLISRGEVCQAAGANDKPVPVALRRRVFGEYGIKGPEPGAYEVDYLITPALGGADDIRNLWPESNKATAWNAQVKDALEDHLREMVCEGRLDLATAQREMATNWIGAYKKYFHTDRPLTAYR